MKYRLILTEKISDSVSTDCLLSEEETLAKFKNIWNCGLNVGSYKKSDAENESEWGKIKEIL